MVPRYVQSLPSGQGEEKMIITPWQMYWITRLDDIAQFFLVSGLGLIMAGTFFFFGWKTHFGEQSFDAERSNLPIAFPILGFFLLMASTMTPSTKDMAAILIVPRIVNNEKVQEIPSKVLDLATEWLEELKPNKEGNKK